MSIAQTLLDDTIPVRSELQDLHSNALLTQYTVQNLCSKKSTQTNIQEIQFKKIL